MTTHIDTCKNPKCGKELRFNNFVSLVKCYDCTTTHFRDKYNRLQIRENLIQSMYPFAGIHLNAKQIPKTPSRNKHTV